MLCFNAKGYVRTCAGVSGGVSRIWIFDPADFDWTLAQADAPAYSVVARRSGATAEGGACMYPVVFQDKEANYQFAHSVTGCAVRYEHTLNLQLPQLSGSLTRFLQYLDAAGCCCGLGFVIELNDGKIFVMGERYVGGAPIPLFKVRQDGTTGDTGKLFSDFNGANVVMKADYSRALLEYSGGISAIVAFEPAA